MIPEYKDTLERIYNDTIIKSEEEMAKLKNMILLVTGQKVRVAINYNPEGTTYEICGYILEHHFQSQTITVIDDYGKIRELALVKVESIEIIP